LQGSISFLSTYEKMNKVLCEHISASICYYNGLQIQWFFSRRHLIFILFENHELPHEKYLFLLYLAISKKRKKKKKTRKNKKKKRKKKKKKKKKEKKEKKI